jgi:hypothetical protein
MNLLNINWGEAIAFATIILTIGLFAFALFSLVARKKMPFACLLALLFALFSLPTFAGQQTQTDTNNLIVFSTNTFILSGDVTGSYTNGQQPGGYQLINCTQGDDVWLEVGGFFTNSTAQSSNIIYRIAGSVTATQWTNNYASVTLAIPASSTNWASATVNIQNVMPFLGLRAIENVNAAAVTGRANSQYLKVYVKSGI